MTAVFLVYALIVFAADVVMINAVVRLIHRRRARRIDIPSRRYDPLYPRPGFRVLTSDDMDAIKTHYNETPVRIPVPRGSYFSLKSGERGKHGVVGE